MSSTLELPPPPAESEQEADYRVRTKSGRIGMNDLEDAWYELGKEAGGPIEQYAWAAANAATGCRAENVRMIAVNKGERLVALAALEEKRLCGVRRRMMLGVDWHHEPMDLLAYDSGALQTLTDAMARDGHPYVFGRLPEESPSVLAIGRSYKGRAWVAVRRQSSYPFIPLDDTWKTPEQHLNSGRRSDLRRAQRRAEKLGPITSEIMLPDLVELEGLLAEALDVEARSWKGRAGTALACNVSGCAFLNEYARAACQEGILRICRLRIGQRTAAMQIGMVQSGGFWLLKIGYDAEFSSCSPGMLLLRESIAYAARAGLNTFEFLGESEPWIETWTPHKRSCVGVRAYPYNLAGGAALAGDTSAWLYRKAQENRKQQAVRLRKLAKAAAMPLLKRAARNYIAGETLNDAKRVVQRLESQGLSGTIGFWDTESQSGREVADQYLAGLDALTHENASAYLSIKLPSLRYSPELLGEVVQRARSVGRRIHFDAMAPESADRTFAMINDVRAATPEVAIGVTLPGRWKRSLDDAQWVARQGLHVRVVKGEWEDPLDPKRDPRAGFLETIDRVAGKARSVGVATHEPKLAEEALQKLQAAGTPCVLELLYGLPTRSQLAVARRLNVGVRVYVPYGQAYMPYALSQIRRKPRILWWLTRDFVVSWFA